MNPLELILTPIGLTGAAFFLGVLVFMVRLTSLSGRHQKRVTRALMAAAKRQAERRFTVIVPLRRRGSSLEGLFENLGSMKYRKLSLVVVAYQTSGKHARRDVNSIARLHGLSVRIVKYRKGLTSEAIIAKQPVTDFIMTIAPEERVTKRFFEKASYALSTGADALEIRPVIRPSITLVSGWRALRSIFVQTSRLSWTRPPVTSGLQDMVIVRRRTFLDGASYRPARYLYESFGIVRTGLQFNKPTWRSLIVLLILSGGLVALCMVTPMNVLGYVTLLMAAVAGVAALMVVAQTVGLTVWDKVQLIALLPFYVIYELIALIGRVIRLGGSVTRKLRRTRQSAPRLRLARTR